MHSNTREGGRRGREEKEERQRTHLEIHARGQEKRKIQTRRDISTANATATRAEGVREILAAIGLLKLAATIQDMMANAVRIISHLCDLIKR